MVEDWLIGPGRPALTRCAWLEVSVGGCKSACSCTLLHTLLDVWIWAGERALQVAVCDQVFSRPGKEKVCHLYLLLDVSPGGWQG